MYHSPSKLKPSNKNMMALLVLEEFEEAAYVAQGSGYCGICNVALFDDENSSGLCEAHHREAIAIERRLK